MLQSLMSDTPRLQQTEEFLKLFALITMDIFPMTSCAIVRLGCSIPKSDHQGQG